MKVTLTIPDSLDEITLKQYKHFLTITKDLDGEFFKQRMIESLCNVKFLRVRMMKRTDVNDIVNSLTNLINEDSEFKHRFFIKDMEFGMIPDLENMTSGEFGDLTEYIGDWQTMNKAMAVLFRPIKERQGDKYSIVDYNGTGATAELLDFMPLSIAKGAMLFFYLLTNELVNAIQASTMEEAAKEILQSQETSEKNGDGISISTHYLGEMLDNLTLSQN
jgi:hypothetical protein